MAKKRIKVTDVNYNQDHLVEFEESDLPAPTPTAEQLAEVIEGSETVVVDVSESGDKLEVHLDADVVAKVDNSLQTPVVAPLDTVLVGVDHSKAQVNLGVGEGLAVENGVLKANIEVPKIITLPQKFFEEGTDIPITDEEIALFTANIIGVKSDLNHYLGVLEHTIASTFITISYGLPYDTNIDTSNMFWIEINKTAKTMRVLASNV